MIPLKLGIALRVIVGTNKRILMMKMASAEYVL
jgi:hypothetical protein